MKLTSAFSFAFVATTLTLTATSAQASFWQELADTLPGGLATDTSGGFFASQLSGARFIMDEGHDGLVISLHTNHPRWDYGNRSQENANPAGGGLMRRIIDNDGNERMFFGIAFSDSHYSVEPTFGYSWVKRYNISDNLHLGAGYLTMLTMRQDYHWLPIPAPLPVINMGTENVGLYMAFIPFTNIFFFYSSITTDAKHGLSGTLPLSSPFQNRTELYGAWMYDKTDSASETGFTVSSDAGALIGLRRFIDDTWAIDVAYSKVDHDTSRYGSFDRSWKMDTYTAALQYHINFSSSVRAHAGAGIGYAKLKQDGGGASASSVFPVVQIGSTWAPTAHTRLMAGINVLFPRFSDIAPTGEPTFQPSPVQMYLGAGIAF